MSATAPHHGTAESRQDHARLLLSRNWWAVALRGIAALIFGVLAVLLPGVTLLTLVLLLAAYFIADGFLAIAAAVRAARQDGRWWPFIIEGLADLAAGAVIFLWPGPSILVLMYLLAIWAIFTGVVMAIGGAGIGTGTPRWLLLLAGALSVALGVMMIARPGLGVLALAWWVGAYGIFFGAVLLALAAWLHTHRTGAPPSAMAK